MRRVAPVNALMLRRARRAFAAASVETERSGAASSSATAPAVQSGARSSAGKREVFWMRDPNTGNWIPENRFGDVDAADLREILLSKK